MPRTKDSTLALLFARHVDNGQPCTCHQTGYCPACGTYRPATEDQEIIEAVSAAATARRTATRVIKKHLEN